MYLIQSIIRPEKILEVAEALAAIGVYGMTKFSVVGRGKQSGLKVGDIMYKDMPKEIVQTIVDAEQKDAAVATIMKVARTGEGNHGDGRVFVIPVAEAYTIRSGDRNY
ncbi:nitrogen regulatory protein P-II [Solidesulfovibrio fructosivorans JJ]]|uniref:Nitrogen regulatory protein P-II n=1 Tax=Solidesulfovibrio fructosivorans JJ] TaxID=596151 RepID=E1JSU4_SOLFR|nr:P-II family nitrogen regulator [Solidesulfovibrio fructosivorans]EFL52577.1 nitrogen regulatory protein P-II [Solidesulfovibrio fructosivorans JJ]]